MTWIQTVDETEATGPVKESYAPYLERLGFVPGAIKALSARPELAVAFHAFQRTLFSQPGLSLRERRLINLAVADRLRSTYCVLAYAAALERELDGVAGVRAVLSDYRAAGLPAREVAIVDYALAVAHGEAREDHVTRLRQLALDDGAILEVAVTAAFMRLETRLWDGLGVEIDPFFLEQEDLVAALPAHHREHLKTR